MYARAVYLEEVAAPRIHTCTSRVYVRMYMLCASRVYALYTLRYRTIRVSVCTQISSERLRLFGAVAPGVCVYMCTSGLYVCVHMVYTLCYIGIRVCTDILGEVGPRVCVYMCTSCLYVSVCVCCVMEALECM